MLPTYVYMEYLFKSSKELRAFKSHLPFLTLMLLKPFIKQTPVRKLRETLEGHKWCHLTSTIQVTTVVKVCILEQKEPKDPISSLLCRYKTQWRSQYQVGHEFIPILPTKTWCPNTQFSIPKVVASSIPKPGTHQWMAVPWATHSSWPILKNPSFPRQPAEHSSSC